MMAMADSTKKPQPGRRRTRTFATPDGVAGRTSLPGLATGFPYRRGRAGLSIRETWTPSAACTPQPSGSASPARACSTAPWQHIEAVVVVSLVVLRLQLASASLFARPKADQLASLHPGPGGLHHPREDVPLPAHLHLAHVECGDTRLEDRLHPTHVNGGCAESRHQIGRTGAGRAPQRVDQRPNDAREICLPRVEARAGWRRGSCH